MLRRTLLPLILGSLPLLLAAPAWSQPKAAGDFKEEEVYQLGEVKERDSIYLAAGGGGSTVQEHNYLVTARSTYGGEVKSVVLMDKKDGPVAKILTGIKPGEYLTMTIQKQYNNTYIRGLAPYALHPGEDQAGVFVFMETLQEKGPGGVDVTAVKLYKLGRVFTVVVPNIRDKASGKMVPDANVSQAVGKLSRGDSVEVATSGGGAAPAIKSIERYAAPQNAVFSKVSEAEVEGARAPAIEVKVGESDKTILVPGKHDAKGALVPEAPLASAIKGFKQGDKVVVRFREDDGKCWLKEIKKAPNPPGKT